MMRSMMRSTMRLNLSMHAPDDLASELPTELRAMETSLARLADADASSAPAGMGPRIARAAAGSVVSAANAPRTAAGTVDRSPPLRLVGTQAPTHVPAGVPTVRRWNLGSLRLAASLAIVGAALAAFLAHLGPAVTPPGASIPPTIASATSLEDDLAFLAGEGGSFGGKLTDLGHEIDWLFAATAALDQADIDTNSAGLMDLDLGSGGAL